MHACVHAGGGSENELSHGHSVMINLGLSLTGPLGMKLIYNSMHARKTLRLGARVSQSSVAIVIIQRVEMRRRRWMKDFDGIVGKIIIERRRIFEDSRLTWGIFDRRQAGRQRSMETIYSSESDWERAEYKYTSRHATPSDKRSK